MISSFLSRAGSLPPGRESCSRSDLPDFPARQGILFGEKAVSDSGSFLNELRSERF